METTSQVVNKIIRFAESNESAESTNLQGVTLTNEMQLSDRKLYLSDRPKNFLFAK